MRTNKASQKSPAPNAPIRFKPTDGQWYDGTYSEDGEYTYENGQKASGVEAWYNVKPATECAAFIAKPETTPTLDSNGNGDGDAVAAPKRKVDNAVAYRGAFDMDKPSDTDGEGWDIYNSVRTIYGLAALPVPATAVMNSQSA